MNVKAVQFVRDAHAFTTYQIKPQMRTLGPRYGKLLGKIGQALAPRTATGRGHPWMPARIMSSSSRGTQVSLAREDLLIRPMQKGRLRRPERGRVHRRARRQHHRGTKARGLPARR